jgi:two-component system, OmpR family, sensor histidine kinase KdpD
VESTREYARAAAILALATALALPFRGRINTIDVAMLYLLAVVAVATLSRRGPALLACVLAIAAFDYVFVPPYYTLDVHDADYLFTFGVMFVVALLMTGLTGRIREQAREASERQRRTAALYELDQELAGAATQAEVVTIAERHIGRAGGGVARFVLPEPEPSGTTEPSWPCDGVFESIPVRVAAAWVHQSGKAGGLGTAHCGEAEALLCPVRTAGRRFGVAALLPQPADRALSGEEAQTTEALAGHTAVVLERVALHEQHEAARAEVEAERLRTSLLSSLSHDLRTPLGTIEGAASSLLASSLPVSSRPEDADGLPLEARRELADTILEESRRMTRLVSNLLDMVRVETGSLAVKKSWQPIEEVLGVTLIRLEEGLRLHPVAVHLPPELPLVPIDEVLVEQVFVNLLENAARYTPPGTTIDVTAWLDGGAVVVEVADRGPGLPAGDTELVFRKFYRASGTSGASPAGGAGLGLTICRGIVTAHGGRIWAEPRPGGGSAFRFTLPLDGGPPEPVPADSVDD